LSASSSFGTAASLLGSGIQPDLIVELPGIAELLKNLNVAGSASTAKVLPYLQRLGTVRARQRHDERRAAHPDRRQRELIRDQAAAEKKACTPSARAGKRHMISTGLVGSWTMDTARRGNYNSGEDFVLEYGELRFTFNEDDFGERCEQAALRLGFVSDRLDGGELEDLVNLAVKRRDPGSGVGTR